MRTYTYQRGGLVALWWFQPGLQVARLLVMPYCADKSVLWGIVLIDES
jgi:hypothetical protein